ncbi:cytochrome-c peroxidase [Bradyrhizobium centrolobii]|uniref:Cytochrome-c peroxidase n=1 Tax=Bradyrhizobium centrolobii TaxID=1505087 RepID=A0A176YU52_9BRAD|nr:cytochrome-c peroxidase [Bradyrhizobium centrolobii]
MTPIPQPPPADPRKLALGERLFNDSRLSADGRLSCASCHDLRTNGADEGRRPADASEPLDTPTVFNAALSFRLTWEGRFRTLSAQAEASIDNPLNMQSSVADVVRRLGEDPVLSAEFRAAYGHDVDRDSFLDALVTFERSLLTPDSRFDRWLRGDASALSPVELSGYQTFKAFGCIACHQGVGIGANLMARQGIFRPLVGRGPSRVRVPSLRNIATTAPYFHDDSAATLEEAVRRMAAAQLDRTLTDEQVASLVAFLKTLTGNYRGRPVTGGAP